MVGALLGFGRSARCASVHSGSNQTGPGLNKSAAVRVSASISDVVCHRIEVSSVPVQLYERQ